MDSGGLPPDWKPTPLPEIGTLRWKRDTIEKSITNKYNYYKPKAWDFDDIGIFVVIYTNGWSSYWVDKKDITIAPKIDWNELVKLGINT